MINQERVDRAEGALDSEGYLFDENGGALTVILADLMHWATARDLDFNVHARIASEHFHEETEGLSLEALEALEGSICKWDLICQGVEVNKGVDNCPLCDLYYIDGGGYACNGCPVSNKTQKMTCEGTPYVDFELLGLHTTLSTFIEMSKVNDDYAEAVELAEAELVFLLGLLPKGHRWRDQI